MYRCPGCRKKCSPDAGLLCPRCYDSVVAENAKTPSQTVVMPPFLLMEVASALSDCSTPRRRKK